MECRIGVVMGLLPSQVREIPSHDRYKLERFYTYEPFGFPREESRHGQLVSAVLRASQRTFGAMSYQASTHMYSNAPPPTMEQQIASLKGATLGMGRRKRGT